MDLNKPVIRGTSFCLVMLLLLGCFASNKTDYPTPSSTPARDILFSNQQAPSGFGAYGYLILTKRPSENNLRRYMNVCAAFIRNLEPVTSYSADPQSWLMPTYWLAEDSTRVNHQQPDCLQWVLKYDYARAKRMASAINTLSSNGPILVAWSQPYETVANEETALVLNLSDFSDDDLDRAFGIWMDRITRDPEIWKAGFNLVLAKEVYRNFLEKYGDYIVSSVKVIKEIVG